MDIFDILGPVMVGPSSSHTAGAARIGAMARTLLGEPVTEAKIHLYGSFAETGRGHGTDRALVAGLLGMKPDDLRIPSAFEEAARAGLRYTFDVISLRDAHPNTAVLEVTGRERQTAHHAGSVARRRADRGQPASTGSRSSFTGDVQHAHRPQSGRVRLRRGRDEHSEPAAHQRGEHELSAARSAGATR